MSRPSKSPGVITWDAHQGKYAYWHEGSEVAVCSRLQTLRNKWPHAIVTMSALK